MELSRQDSHSLVLKQSRGLVRRLLNSMLMKAYSATGGHVSGRETLRSFEAPCGAMPSGAMPSINVPKQPIHAERPSAEQVQPSPSAETELADDLDAEVQQAFEKVERLLNMQRQRDEEKKSIGNVKIGSQSRF